MTRTLLAAVAAVLAGTSAASADTAEFTADAVQKQAGQGMQSGRLYVGAAGTRFEFQDQGRPVVQIALPGEGIMRVLFPLDRSYLEMKAGAGAATPAARPSEPCKPAPDLECNRDGEEQIAGMKLERWTIKPKGAPGEIRIWWDPERHMPLRQVLFDGSTMQAIMTGTEDHEGRKVESWEITYTSPNGQYRRGMALYSPELGTTVLEQQPGGTMRELRNITVGKVDTKLFDVPEGYKKIEPPPPPTPGTQAPPPQSGAMPPAGQAPTDRSAAPAGPFGGVAPPPPDRPGAQPMGPPPGQRMGPQMGQQMPGPMGGDQGPQMGPPPGHRMGPQMGQQMPGPMGGDQGPQMGPPPGHRMGPQMGQQMPGPMGGDQGPPMGPPPGQYVGPQGYQQAPGYGPGPYGGQAQPGPQGYGYGPQPGYPYQGARPQ